MVCDGSVVKNTANSRSDTPVVTAVSQVIQKNVVVGKHIWSCEP